MLTVEKNTISLTHLSIGFSFWLLLGATAARADDAPVDFSSQIAPIFERHCIRCHSPGNRKGDISLATIADLKASEFIFAGDPDGSYLIELVTASGGQPPSMPKEGEPLSQGEVALLRRWIAEGVRWPPDFVVREQSKADASWWSLQPLADVQPPGPANLPPAWKVNPVDRFIFAKLIEKQLTPNPPADRRTLIRRATYDLTGLPPNPAQVDAFLNDPDPEAYEKLIGRLLESPQYGERWGRHWLDVVRYGESIGYERNVIIDNLWPFRDYVIESIQADKPFDQFLREHLAGDVIDPDDPAVAVGSAFLVAGPYDDVGNQDAVQAAQIRANTLDEIVSATGQAFLAMTLGCARCHDHKFDPISQRDYYSLYATFAGIRHGAAPLATAQAKADRHAKLEPLHLRQAALEKAQQELQTKVRERAFAKRASYEARWTRPPVDRTGTEELFEPVTTRFVRLVCEAQDVNPNVATGFGIDEFEIWTAEARPRNVALAALGGKATGKARRIEDFPDAYGPQLAIDGRTGARFLSIGTDLTIELAQPTPINRVVFSSARHEPTPDLPQFAFVAEYRIEISDDGEHWREVAHGRDRMPVGKKGASPTNTPAAHEEFRLLQLEMAEGERAERARLARELAEVHREIANVPALPLVWIGTRSADDARGPFHVFLGGSPQNKGEAVVPASISVFDVRRPTSDDRGGASLPPGGPGYRREHGERGYRLAGDAPESERRRALANWISDPSNALTWRVLANRIWQYHFGTGIVDTPSDFGFMGGRPTHPELLDFLAGQLRASGFRIKALHRLIMTSQSYRQSSDFRDDAARIDGDARRLWRFPPRRLSAEEIRDTMLQVSGKLDLTRGGPGFRLYHFMQDNVCTYVPLDKHGPETYRRAVYHQNARASVVDLLTDFDQPDCTFSVPKRAATTTPLQALTMLNHAFTLDMARFLAERLQREAGDDPIAQIRQGYAWCFARPPTGDETSACRELIGRHGLPALCRVLLNTSELIYVR